MSATITKLGEAESILMTHQCRLLMGKTATDTAVENGKSFQHFVTINNVRIDMSHPEQRVDVGLKRIYFHAKPDIELSFTARGTKDSIGILAERGKQDDNGWIAERTWFFDAKSVAAATQETRTVKIKGQLIDYSLERPSDDQTQPLACSARIRITDDAPTIT